VRYVRAVYLCGESDFYFAGWHVVGGPAHVGKSVRTLSALRKFLHNRRMDLAAAQQALEDSTALDLGFSSRTASYHNLRSVRSPGQLAVVDMGSPTASVNDHPPMQPSEFSVANAVQTADSLLDPLAYLRSVSVPDKIKSPPSKSGLATKNIIGSSPVSSRTSSPTRVLNQDPQILRSSINEATMKAYIDCLYADLRNCSSAVEVMGALAHQWHMKGDTILELEIYLRKFIQKLKPGSVLVFDHLTTSQSATVLLHLFDFISPTTVLMVLTAGALFSDADKSSEMNTVVRKKTDHRLLSSASEDGYGFDAVYQRVASNDLLDSVFGNVVDTTETIFDDGWKRRPDMKADPSFVAVASGLGGSLRLKFQDPSSRSFVLLQSLPRDNSAELVSLFMEEVNVRCRGIFPSNKGGLNHGSVKASQPGEDSGKSTITALGDSTLSSVSATKKGIGFNSSNVAINMKQLTFHESVTDWPAKRRGKHDITPSDSNTMSANETIEVILTLSHGDPLVIELLCQCSDHELAAFVKAQTATSAKSDTTNAMNRRAAVSTAEPLTPDQIFASYEIFEDANVLCLIACLAPLFSLYGTYFHRALAWDLCKDVFVRVFADREGYAVQSTALEEGADVDAAYGANNRPVADSATMSRIERSAYFTFLNSWDGLLRCGWLTSSSAVSGNQQNFADVGITVEPVSSVSDDLCYSSVSQSTDGGGVSVRFGAEQNKPIQQPHRLLATMGSKAYLRSKSFRYDPHISSSSTVGSDIPGPTVYNTNQSSIRSIGGNLDIDATVTEQTQLPSSVTNSLQAVIEGTAGDPLKDGDEASGSDTDGVFEPESDNEVMEQLNAFNAPAPSKKTYRKVTLQESPDKEARRPTDVTSELPRTPPLSEARSNGSLISARSQNRLRRRGTASSLEWAGVSTQNLTSLISENIQAYCRTRKFGLDQSEYVSISTAAVSASELLDKALIAVLQETGSNIDDAMDFLQIQWDKYYLHWSLRCVVISQELFLRGYSIFPNGCSVEGALIDDSAADRHFGALEFRDIIDIVDEDILHLSRLFALWMVRPHKTVVSS
jgi:hypothetical protein